jgi:phosphoadenosine phosphosulfate reductase
MVSNFISSKNIALFNENLRHELPEDIIQFVLQYAEKSVVTTSFGAHSAAILYATTHVKADIQVIWCDTNYNTKATYRHADNLIKDLNLNVEVFSPIQSDSILKSKEELMKLNQEDYNRFAENVKLEPFKRAMKKHNPDVWFTTVRRKQSSYRDSIDILSFTGDGILKVSPFYYYDDNQIRAYLMEHNLPIEYDYFDPVKIFGHKECGIQLLN